MLKTFLINQSGIGEAIFVGDLAMIQRCIDSGNSADRRWVGIRFDGDNNAA